MKVLMVAAEAAPFVKTGGLADVIGSLPKALAGIGAEVRVILPKYEDMAAKWREKLKPVTAFEVELGWRRQYGGVETLTHDGITYYFIDNEYYFRRRGLYGYGDDAERFAYFCKAVLEALPRLGWEPDVLHCHDWHAALVPVFLRARDGESESGRHRPLKTVFTIHNLKYQGVFPAGVLGDVLGLGLEHFHVNGLEFYGNVNYMKGALNCSDRITTVSPTYAAEIQTPMYGEGLDGVLRYRKDRLTGIVNGLDTREYDPMTDPHLAANYSGFFDEKRVNKAALQEELGLPADDTIPVIALVSRLVEQKGLDLIAYVLEELLQERLQLIVLGTGDDMYEKMFRDAAYHHPDKLAARIVFDEGLARRFYAASDLFLMPSRFEPCGIGQLIAMRYGSVPIVRETGGLRDTVVPYNEFTGEGHGFTFTHYNSHDMLYTMRRALAIHKDETHWRCIIDNVAKQDVSWDASAKQYARLYDQLLA
ncbi:glycogen synthase GlgA [Paenibacillus thermotolerans]|uniref:glycogen synthase GlgA n=1 Tax=Paenibacillus thermotolerans TaxID=3027807 RepID=UPI0023689ABF|nr:MULTISPECIES: glycogen synthase GlgA [unclassified Paenibacillus]